MDNIVVVKFQLSDFEIRRISVSSKTGWEEVVSIAKNMFPQLEGIILQYKDDEGSNITVKSDIEFQEAKRVAQAKGSSLLFFVEKARPPQHSQEIVHRFVTCDGCQQSPLRGSRYHCNSCYNFDLCEACNEKSKHGTQFQSHTADHQMIEIPAYGGRFWRKRNACSHSTGSVPVKKEETTTTEEKKEDNPVTITPQINTTAAETTVVEKQKEEKEDKVVEKSEEEKKTEEALELLNELGLINGATEDERKNQREQLIELLKTNNYEATEVIEIFFN